jgi:hypothetical protein
MRQICGAGLFHVEAHYCIDPVSRQMSGGHEHMSYIVLLVFALTSVDL